MNKVYHIQLGNKTIGTTLLEKADAPMGVVVGKMKLEGIKEPYRFFKDYCQKHNIALNMDEAEYGAIDTQVIPELVVLSEDGVEIKGIGSCIGGLVEEGYEITILGIPYPFYETQFPHHVKAYNEMHRIA